MAPSPRIGRHLSLHRLPPPGTLAHFLALRRRPPPRTRAIRARAIRARAIRQRIRRARRAKSTKPRHADAAAVVIGIEYTAYARRGLAERLPGCHRDARRMRQLLINKYNLSPKSIVTLVDAPGHRPPTKRNILHALGRLVRASKKRMLWLTYSGHGGSMPDQGRDEADGWDETLIPCDYLHKGQIRDDVVADRLLGLRANASFLGIFDSCHSGSVADLPVQFQNPNSGEVLLPARDSKTSTRLRKHPATMVTLSACTDQQTAASAFNLDEARKWQGAMTHAFARLPRGKLDGASALRQMQTHVSARGFSQITTLSTNRDVKQVGDIVLPHPG